MRRVMRTQAAFRSRSLRQEVKAMVIYFLEVKKYGLSINGIKIGGFRIKRIDLVGTASNLRSASDIIGTYTADAKDATVAYTRMAQLGNQKGVVLEVRGVNLNRRFTLNLSGMNIKNLGWQPPPE
jgi:hypothetical protein